MSDVNDNRRRVVDEDIRQTLAVFDREVASEDDVDAAFDTVVRALPRRSPSDGFATRVVLAVRQAPLPARREALARGPRQAWTAARAAATVVMAAALAYVAVLVTPVGVPVFGRILALCVQAFLWFILSAGAGLDVLAVLTSTSGAIATAITSEQILTGLVGVTFVGALSFAALTRLLSSQQESTQW